MLFTERSGDLTSISNSGDASRFASLGFKLLPFEAEKPPSLLLMPPLGLRSRDGVFFEMVGLLWASPPSPSASVSFGGYFSSGFNLLSLEERLFLDFKLPEYKLDSSSSSSS
jgi:hypothetical protein